MVYGDTAVVVDLPRASQSVVRVISESSGSRKLDTTERIACHLIVVRFEGNIDPYGLAAYHMRCLP